MLNQLRQYRHRFAARLGVALASAWLVFAAVPCSALPLFDAAHGHAMAGQVMPAAPAAGHDCPHCPAAMPAAATAGDCTGLDDAVISKIGVLDLTLAAPQSLPTFAGAITVARVGAATRAAPTRPPAVPLNLRYCTFIE